MLDHAHDVLAMAMERLILRRGVLDPAQAVPGLGASLSEALALGYLMGGGLTQHDLGTRLELEKSTVSRMVDAMIRKGWVEKTRDPENRRYQLVRLTTRGRKAATQIATTMQERHARWMAALTPKEREAVIVGLNALVRVMSEDLHWTEDHHSAHPHPHTGESAARATGRRASSVRVH